MQEKDLKRFHEWYDKTIGSLRADKEDVKQSMIRKKEHTSRVCDHIQRLGQSLGLSENDSRLAVTIALFHDVGRFYQYLEYQTFIDFIEPIKDHAELGVIVLEKSKILNVLSQEEKNIVLQAISYHNLYELPRIENERVLLFSKLIRDADKLDIYEFHVRCFEEKSEYHNPILKAFPDIPEYSVQNIQDILNNRCPVNAHIKTYNDLKLTYVAWIFDINFYFAIKQVIDNEYMERLITVLPNNKDIHTIRSHVREYIDKKIHLLA